MPKYSTLVWVILFTCIALPSLGQLQMQRNAFIELENLSLKQGLSQSSVYAILKDQRGFVWFGTQDGLNRYDGYGFKIYKKDPSAFQSLSDNWIKSLAKDTQFIWIGTDNGLNRYDASQDSFLSFLPQNGNPKSLNHKEITALCVDNTQKILWIGTPKGIQTLHLNNENPNDLSFERVALAAGEIGVNSIYQDKRGNLWIGHQKGIEKWNTQKKRFEIFEFTTPTPDLLQETLKGTAFLQDEKNNLWITASQYLFQLDAKSLLTKNTWDLTTISKQEDEKKILTTGIQQDKTGVIWITSNEGLFKYNPANQLFKHITKDIRNPDGLTANELFTVYADLSGIIWLGTYTGGVNKFDVRNRYFKHYFRNASDSKSLSSNNVRCFWEESPESYWVGTYGGGLNLFDQRNNTFQQFRHDKNDPNSISDNDVQVVFKDSQKTLWVGTKSGGLNRYDPATNHFKRYPFSQNIDAPSKKALLSPFVRVIYEDKKGNLWIGTRGGGLSLLDRKTGTFQHFLHNKNNPQSISGNTVYSILQDSQGILWIGTREAGLNRFDYTTGTFQSYQHNDQDPQSLSHNNVLCIFEDSQQRLWVGTYGGALNLFDRQKQVFTQYTEQDGLLNDVAYGILEDTQQRLWISTNKGIALFDPRILSQKPIAFDDGFTYRKPAFKMFDVFDGLQSNEFNGGAYYKTSKGEMLFGGINGFTSFQPHEIEENRTLPPVALTDFQLFNLSQSVGMGVLQRSIQETKQIILQYDQAVFSFEFVALNFVRPEKNEYAYRLIGFKNDIWTRTSRRFVTYTNLNPGTYTFEVRAANNEGEWNPEKTTLKVTILPPFWLTWWFWTLAVVLFIGAVYSFYQWRIYRLKKHEEALEREVIRQTAQINQQKEEILATLENLKETQAQLLDADKMASLGQLTAGIAHEINNPINFVFAGINSLKANINDVLEVLEAYSEITDENVAQQLEEVNALKEDIEYDEVIEEMQELADSIKRGAERTAEIVKGLRTFSRLDEDDLKTADVHENLDATLSILRNQYKDRIEIIKDYGNIPTIECYAGKLNQVYMNILANAMQAIEGNGNITIKTDNILLSQNETHIEGVAIHITDTGKGMPDEVKKRIFEPFFTTKDVGKGTGLGLSIVHSIIEKHQGKIEVESTEGIGSTFKISLPLKPIVKKI